MTDALSLRARIEDFLYEEAALLDEWKLKDWLALMTEDIVYEVPPTDAPDANSEDTLFLVADNAMRLHSRVEQLLSGETWAESPLSRTRRLVNNVRILDQRDDEIDVTANFVIHRFRGENVDVYVGRYQHILVRREGRFLIRRRRSVLDQLSLRREGKVSIIL